MSLYRISRNLENFRFWDQINLKNVNDKNFDKINMKIVISIQQCITAQNFSKFEELPVLGPNLSKEKMNDKN